MLINLFVPTGEVRKANRCEWFMDPMIGLEKCCSAETTYEYPIMQLHQIEVSDDVRRISLDEHFIDLPRPKKKVKKWQWVMKQPIGASSQPYFVTACHYTEDEVSKEFNSRIIMKIPETEIEVEI